MTMNEIWHKLNCILTQRERNEFNRWKLDLWVLSDKAMDGARRDPNAVALDAANALHDAISRIPSLLQ